MRMKKVKIKQISLHNFKGFAELNVSFEDNDAVVLGGLNGYGKTTLFDALELLFTGQIKRMAGYVDYHDSRNTASQDYKPLVYKNEYSIEVKIKALLEIDRVDISIMRKAKVDNMRNPVDFRAFSGLLIEEADGTERLLEEDEMNNLGLSDLQKSYSFLNYLSQEEATAFLKRKEADRAKDISELFNLTPFDEPLNKIKVIDTGLKKKKIDTATEEEKIKAQIVSLKQNAGNEKSSIAYKQICKEKLFWDVEEPKLSHEQFHSLLSEGGLMDNLLLFIKHKDEYKQYRINNFVDTILQDDRKVSGLAFLLKYENLIGLFELYRQFQDDVVKPCLNLNFESLASFELKIPKELVGQVQKQDINFCKKLKDNLCQLYASSVALHRDVAKMLEDRNCFVKDIFLNIKELPSTDCPLCGKHFEDRDQLLKVIGNYGKIFNSHFQESGKALQMELNNLRGYVQDHFIKPINSYFSQAGYSVHLETIYSDSDIQFAKRNLHAMTERLEIHITGDFTFEGLHAKLKSELYDRKQKLSDGIDFKLLDSIYQNVARFVSKENLNEDAISSKRSYLQMIWGQMASQDLQKCQTALDKTSKRLKSINSLIKGFSKLKKEIENQRQSYFSTLLSDIKILFYIYSGRIMQTCYFGRGLFIKPDAKCKHIIFTSGTSEGNDVDALFNMSSGQLVTLVISLLLSLNKLYGKTSILAIDDPIQTIDDINLWGLIETLRHDFDDHFLLLSTHERDYRDLLAYKLDKWGINTKIVDMSEVESVR